MRINRLLLYLITRREKEGKERKMRVVEVQVTIRNLSIAYHFRSSSVLVSKVQFFLLPLLLLFCFIDILRILLLKFPFFTVPKNFCQQDYCLSYSKFIIVIFSLFFMFNCSLYCHLRDSNLFSRFNMW